ncbi:Malate dehydrogenase isoform 2, partial [Schistosoma japonicum]
SLFVVFNDYNAEVIERISKMVLRYCSCIVFRTHVRNLSHYTPPGYTKVVSAAEIKKFCVQCLTKVGAQSRHAIALSDVLISGDYRGHYSHGLNRLEMYVQDIKKGVCATDTEPAIVKETVSTALVDGKNAMGPVVGNFAMGKAIAKAQKTGIAFVAAFGSNHFGIAGWYSLMALQEGLIGLAFTNTSPLVFPTRARKLAVGTNPLTLAAPGKVPDDHFVLDMATSAVALGKIEMNRRRGLEIPIGWGADQDGKTCVDPNLVVTKGGLMPLGGEEEHSGYKGYGLGMLVEILCGIIANADFGPNVRRWMTTEKQANLGQSFLAIDPKAFAPGFEQRLSEYVNIMRNLPPVNDKEPVVVPGDFEREHMIECDQLGGIPYPPVLLESLVSCVILCLLLLVSQISCL